ncbi:MAG: PBP1A family penicillin-binding protein [Sulfuritalea sp.]|nr:PBP1A family penicillin-binding protein [Sulfuritalea sp.]MDP1981048.1 PBP1A family penicillin-binding protein [Sulfuritalea sp.]
MTRPPLLLKLLTALSALLLAGVLAIGITAAVLYPQLPTLDVLTHYRPALPLRILSADGHLIGEFGVERRTLVEADAVPQLLKQAIVAAEDERFFVHGGVDYVGMLRAMLTNLVSGTRHGAGTITMQVARNFFLSREKTLSRKFNEVLLAYKIEATLAKAQILDLYLNQIYLGQGAYGFGQAALTYFDKPLQNLGPAEMAMLAGLPKAPSEFNPIVNPSRARLRQEYVLRRMHELGTLTALEWEQARAEALAFRTPRNGAAGAEYAAEMVRQSVFDTYGDSTYTRGLVVHTTLRWNEQVAANAALRRGVLDYAARHAPRGGRAGGAAASPLPQAALVALAPQDGAILAMAGGFDFRASQFNHATQAMRQPGSSFKPFIYSAALAAGFTPESVLLDAPLDLVAPNGQRWQPGNYDGRYDGPLPLAAALARSKNTVAIRLLDAVGVDAAREHLGRFGFEPRHHPANLTLALGTGATTPLQMAAAYAVFANGGWRVAPYLVARIEDARGEVLAEHTAPGAQDEARRAIPAEKALQMTAMMQETIASGTATRARVLGRADLAGKTGTTNDYIDAWFAGYSPARVAVAWIGFDRPHSLGRGETGGTAALPMWIEYMSKAER